MIPTQDTGFKTRPGYKLAKKWIPAVSVPSQKKNSNFHFYVITVFTRVLVDPMYKSTPYFWGKNWVFFISREECPWKIILYFLE